MRRHRHTGSKIDRRRCRPRAGRSRIAETSRDRALVALVTAPATRLVARGHVSRGSKAGFPVVQALMPMLDRFSQNGPPLRRPSLGEERPGVETSGPFTKSTDSASRLSFLRRFSIFARRSASRRRRGPRRFSSSSRNAANPDLRITRSQKAIQ